MDHGERELDTRRDWIPDIAVREWRTSEKGGKNPVLPFFLPPRIHIKGGKTPRGGAKTVREHVVMEISQRYPPGGPSF